MGTYTLDGDGRQVDADPGPFCAEAQFWGVEPALLTALSEWQSPHSHVAECQSKVRSRSLEQHTARAGAGKALHLLDSSTHSSAAAIILPIYLCG